MSIRKAQPSTIPVLLIAITCMLTCMMDANLGSAEPIAPSPFAFESNSNNQGPAASTSEVLAAPPPPSTNPKTSQSRGGSIPLPFWIIGDVEECMNSIINTKDCPFQIINSIITLQLGDIEPECCKAVLSVKEGCLDKIPLVSSLIPSVLRDACAKTIIASLRI